MAVWSDTLQPEKRDPDTIHQVSTVNDTDDEVHLHFKRTFLNSHSSPAATDATVVTSTQKEELLYPATDDTSSSISEIPRNRSTEGLIEPVKRRKVWPSPCVRSTPPISVESIVAESNTRRTRIAASASMSASMSLAGSPSDHIEVLEVENASLDYLKR